MRDKVAVITGASGGIGAALAVIAGVIESRRPDVYTRSGAHDRVVGYYASLGAAS